jgi:hypothetical protein
LNLLVNNFFHFYIHRIDLLTNLSFLSFLLFPSLHFLASSSYDRLDVVCFRRVKLFFFVCRSRCRCYTKRVHSLYYRRRSCRTRIENGAERKRKKEKTTKVRRPIIPLHIHISLLTLSFLFFFFFSPSPCYRLVET